MAEPRSIRERERQLALRAKAEEAARNLGNAPSEFQFDPTFYGGQ